MQTFLDSVPLAMVLAYRASWRPAGTGKFPVDAVLALPYKEPIVRGMRGKWGCMARPRRTPCSRRFFRRSAPSARVSSGSSSLAPAPGARTRAIPIYDLLLVVDQKHPPLLDPLYDAVMDALLTYGRLVSLKVFEKREFERLQGLRTPFMARIAEEGVPLG